MSDYGGSSQDLNAATVAAFSPQSISNAPSATRTRSTIIVHQKSPLLIATPPQVTRALAHSHPFLLPLNKLVGLVTWTSGDTWESFLFLTVFWGLVLYGDVVLRWGGPVLLVTTLIVAMYARRFSPLSTTAAADKPKERKHEADNYRHQKSLDEIVECMNEFTSRCNILMEPLLDLTDFLSTQQTAISATTRPALTALFLRILLISPLWATLAVWPLHIITTKRYCLTLGTVILTYHCKPARVMRALVWRSKIFRTVCSKITGLDFSLEIEGIETNEVSTIDSTTLKRTNTVTETKRRAAPPGVRFTFIIYENQRRWIGLGWTNSLFAYERGAWTDDQLNSVQPKGEFHLRVQEGSSAKWRWVEGSTWRIEDGNSDRLQKGQKQEDKKSGDDSGGWIYYDNKWQDPRRGKDGWNRYTRRRKWYRDAELVEVGTPDPPRATDSTPLEQKTLMPKSDMARTTSVKTDKSNLTTGRKSMDDADAGDGDSSSSSRRRRVHRSSRESSLKSVDGGRDNRDAEHGDREADRASNSGWGLGDEARMGLG